MNKFTNVIANILGSLIYVLSLLPMRVQYAFSDCIYAVLYYIVRYRRTTVRRNLRESFPDMDEAGRRKTEREFYHWLCDYFFETFKLMSIGEEEMRRRMTFKGIDKMEEFLREGKSCGLFLGHYCNWEWVSTIPLHIRSECQCGELYHPLRSAVADRLFLRLRQRFNTVCIPKNESLRWIVRYRREGKPLVMGYIADQKPKWQNIHLWMEFLSHKDTPVFTGAERIVKLTRQAFFYCDMRRTRRGYYECDVRLMSEDSAGLPDFKMTEIYMSELEKSIRRQPAYYLWSHDRWSRTREEFDRRFYVKDGKVHER